MLGASCVALGLNPCIGLPRRSITGLQNKSISGNQLPARNHSLSYIPSKGYSSGKLIFPGSVFAKASEEPGSESSETGVDVVPENEATTVDSKSEEEKAEDEARRRSWERGWAPWEEITTKEGEFALASLKEDTIENPKLPREVMDILDTKKHMVKGKERWDEEARKQAEIENEISKITREGSLWDMPLVFKLIPPRDWPPPGWKVDPTELAFIREAHSIHDNMVVTTEDLVDTQPLDHPVACFDRWKTFLKQYKDWVAANKSILEADAIEADPEYHPGRRRRGNDYRDGMYELPFVYPGQHYWGVVTCIHLYQGAFVYIGAVHDGWVPIKGNDWYEIRKYIRVGLRVQVEVVAKRDPYRYRFPIELRFVDPNINNLIFNKFDYPPIFTRPGDVNLYELAKETGRPFVPLLRPEKKPVEEKLRLVHPYVPKVWQLHMAEQMTLDEEEGVGKNNHEEKINSDIWEDENGIVVNEKDLKDERTEGDVYGNIRVIKKMGDYHIPRVIVKLDENELDLEEARKERRTNDELWMKAKKIGEEFVEPELRRELQMDELNHLHKQRAYEEQEALERDITCRLEFGLPLEELGRYSDDPWGANVYNPRKSIWKRDYLGEISRRRGRYKRDRQSRRNASKKEAQLKPSATLPTPSITPDEMQIEYENGDDEDGDDDSVQWLDPLGDYQAEMSSCPEGKRSMFVFKK